MKTRPTQKFWPLQKQILPPLELRSSCGIDMCVKKIVPHQPEASPHVTDYESFSLLQNSLLLNTKFVEIHTKAIKQ